MNTETPALPESVRVAVEAITGALATAQAEEVAEILYPVREEWLEAVESGQAVDGFAVADAIPPLAYPLADAAVDLFLSETWDDAIRAMPISLTFIEANPLRPLSGLRVLAFEDGKAGRAYADWANDASMALVAAMRLPNGPIPARYEAIMAALETAFDDGRTAGGIEDDPPRPAPHPVYAARVEKAQQAVEVRLSDASDLDEFADTIRDEFEIQHGDAWLAVEEVSRAAAVDGDLHAARLRRQRILGVHEWFVEHAEMLEARKALTVGTMIAADRSREFLRRAAA